MGYPFSPPKKVAQIARFRYASGEQRRRFNAGANDSPICTRRNFTLQAVEQTPQKIGATPLKINTLNPTITQLKRKIIWTKPPWLWVPMLIFRGAVPDTVLQVWVKIPLIKAVANTTGNQVGICQSHLTNLDLRLWMLRMEKFQADPLNGGETWWFTQGRKATNHLETKIQAKGLQVTILLPEICSFSSILAFPPLF